MLITYDPDDHSTIEKILSKGNTRYKGLCFQDTYRRRHAVTPDMAWMDELDQEHGLSLYDKADAFGRYHLAAVDAGFLEYTLKNLQTPSELLGDHQRYYCPRAVQQLAEQLYGEARESLP